MLIESHQDGVILSIKAFPGAKRNEVRWTDDCLKVYVTQIAEKGKANKSLLKQLAQSLKLRTSQVELLQGGTSIHKKVILRNISAEAVLERAQLCSEKAEVSTQKTSTRRNRTSNTKRIAANVNNQDQSGNACDTDWSVCHCAISSADTS